MHQCVPQRVRLQHALPAGDLNIGHLHVGTHPIRHSFLRSLLVLSLGRPSRRSVIRTVMFRPRISSKSLGWCLQCFRYDICIYPTQPAGQLLHTWHRHRRLCPLFASLRICPAAPYLLRCTGEEGIHHDADYSHAK